MASLSQWLARSLELLDSLLGGKPLVQAAIVLAIFLVLAKVVDLVATRLFKVWAKRSKTDFDDRVLELIHRPIFVTVLIVGLGLAFSRLDIADPMGRAVPRFLRSLLILIWAVFLHRASALVLDSLSTLGRGKKFLDERFVALFENLAKLFVAGGAVYFILLVWDVDVGGLLLGAGVMGIALGLAAKDTLANLFSGIFILADAPYKEGDFINLDSGERGKVTKIGLRSTRLLTQDDVEITIPNSVIANAKIVNESGGPSLKYRVRVKVGVAYGTDVDKVKQILEEVARENKLITGDPAPRVRFRAFGDSSLDLELLGWIDEPVLRGRTLDALYTEVYKRFQAEEIEIPYPKRDVYLRKEE